MIGPSEPSGGEPDFDARALLRALNRAMTGSESSKTSEAQHVLFEAVEAPTDEEEFELIQQVLRLDPGNVDALLVAVRHCDLETAEDEIRILRKIVAVGECGLGPDPFKEFAGAFWGFLETRPYMRARAQLADALCYAGYIDDAIAEWEMMLELNPDDNQGTRYRLLPLYLATEQMDNAGRLFRKYDECAWSTVFAWGRVLERYLEEDNTGARSAMFVARKQNAHTEAYLTGRKRLPEIAPEIYSPGSEEEAVTFAGPLIMAWEAHPHALPWLLEQP